MSTNAVRKPYAIQSRDVWSEIRRQYLGGVRPAELCRRFGLARSTLTTRRSVEGWDEQRLVLQRIKQPSGPLRRAPVPTEEDVTVVAQDPPAGANYVSLEPDPGRALEVTDIAVRNVAEAASSARASAVNDAYLELAGSLRRRIDLMVTEDSIGTAPGARPSRDVLDAASALEKLQKVERTALGLEAHAAAGPQNVIIVVPPKLSPEVWLARARALREGRVEIDEQRDDESTDG